MPIKHWHGGKLILLWTVAAFVAWVGYTLTMDASAPDVQLWIGLGLMLAAPVACLVVTWKWLSGREAAD